MISPTVGWFCVLAITGSSPGQSSPKWEEARLSGKVIVLSAALAEMGLTFDAEPITKQVALVEADGTVIPLLSDEASRAFFLDERLRGRSAELRVRRFAKSPYAQVVSFQVREGGRLQTPEYYCEICTISVRYPQICPCCQGPMVLRMRPEAH
jgi:hypothetical protein